MTTAHTHAYHACGSTEELCLLRPWVTFLAGVTNVCYYVKQLPEHSAVQTAGCADSRPAAAAATSDLVWPV